MTDIELAQLRLQIISLLIPKFNVNHVELLKAARAVEKYVTQKKKVAA